MYRTLIPILLFALLLFSCKVYEKIPTVSFRGPTLKGVQTNVDLQQIKIDLGLKFLFKNPFKKDLVIPEHEFTIKLNGQEIPGQLQRQNSFRIDKESEKLVTYTYRFDLSPGSVLHSMNVLGKDNVYEFITEVEIDLKDFGVDVPSKIGKIPLRKHKLEFSFDDVIRLPLLPVVQPSAQAGKIRFLGQMETFNLEPIKNAMEPMVDLLLDARFDSEMTDPFVDLLLNWTIDVPAPTASNPLRTKKVIVGDHIVNTILKPLDPQAPQKWTEFKAQMQPGNINLMDHFVETVLKPVNSQSVSQWNAFKQQWEAFKNSNLSFQFPGNGVTGLQIEIPFRMYNPNQFAIHAPSVTAVANQGTYQPFQFQVLSNGSNLVAGQSSREMKVIMILSWREANSSFLDFLQGKNYNPQLKGKSSIDIGYDLMEVEFDIPFNLQGGFD